MAEAGWYQDPQDNSLWRYFDGQAWTEHVQPVHESGEEGQASSLEESSASPEQELRLNSLGIPQAPGQEAFDPSLQTKPKRSPSELVLFALIILVVCFFLYTKVLNKPDAPSVAVKQFVTVVAGDRPDEGCALLTEKAKSAVPTALKAAGVPVSACEDAMPAIKTLLEAGGIDEKSKFTTVYGADKSSATVYYESKLVGNQTVSLLKVGDKWLIDSFSVPSAPAPGAAPTP